MVYRNGSKCQCNEIVDPLGKIIPFPNTMTPIALEPAFRSENGENPQPKEI